MLELMHLKYGNTATVRITMATATCFMWNQNCVFILFPRMVKQPCPWQKQPVIKTSLIYWHLMHLSPRPQETSSELHTRLFPWSFFLLQNRKKHEQILCMTLYEDKHGAAFLTSGNGAFLFCLCHNVQWGFLLIKWLMRVEQI